ncbi:hypothetical protein [Cellvibrio sp. NN19]|uniref:hypothetical protein n=1 Tax=Cellvibrio chitinivorans TaxID=3102792 RepID=UPI002B414BB3|nr:hypothetical protein [Cellvibrio sp. NN19]
MKLKNYRKYKQSDEVEMSIIDTFEGVSSAEIEKAFNSLDNAFDNYFSEHGERRRFMEACRKLSYGDIGIIQKLISESSAILDYQHLADMIENPLRVADAILMLEKELEKTESTTFLLFLLVLVKRDKVTDALNKARFLPWEYSLLRNKKLPPEFIEHLWTHNKSRRYKTDVYFDNVKDIAKHQNCPSHVLRELYSVDDLWIRNAIAYNCNIDEDLTDIFLNSSRMAERERIAKSKYVSKEALLSLMRDKYENVSQTAKKQFGKLYPTEVITEKAIDEAIKKRIANPYIKINESERKFNAYLDAKKGIEHILTLKPSQRASVARVARAEVLAHLAGDKSNIVRRSVAGNGGCTTEVLSSYLMDSDPIVVNNAFLNLANKQPNLIFEQVLSRDVVDHSYNLLNVYLGQKGLIEPYYEKIDSVTEMEIARVCLVARYTNNPMIQLRIVDDLSSLPPAPSVRKKLLSGLSHNLHLIDSAVRKIAIDLNFGGEDILINCKSADIVAEFLSNEKIPAGTRWRIETHLESLKNIKTGSS